MSIIHLVLTEVFLTSTLSAIQVFNGVRQRRMKVKFKMLASKFKSESNNFIFNNCKVCTEMMLYLLLTNLLTWI